MPSEMYPTEAFQDITVKAVDESLSLVVEEDDLGESVFVVEYYEVDPVETPAMFVMPSPDDCDATLPATSPSPPIVAFVNPTDVNASIQGLIQVGINSTGTTTTGRRLDELMSAGAELWGARPEEETLPEIASHVRRLWGAATSTTSNEMWYASGGGYDGNPEGRFTPWSTCVSGNARAQFFYKCDHRGCNMNLAFAGSDDWKDWVFNNANLFPGGPGGKYHAGFYNYQNWLSGCVNNYRNQLRGWGIQLDYITGHSLGGGAATVYAQEHGNGLKGTVTYGAPKTNQVIAGGSRVTGWRFMHADDPVTSSACFLGCAMRLHQHVVSSATEYYDKLECWNERASRRVQSKVKKCQKKWWKFWCWFEVAWTTVYEWVRSCAWKKKMRSVGYSFAHNFYSLIWGAYGALAKHSAYAEYPSINL